MIYTRENIVEGINNKLNRMCANKPEMVTFCAMCKAMMQDYPMEIEQNVLEWVNDLPITEIDCHGISIKHVMDSKKLSDEYFPVVVQNFKQCKKYNFESTYMCYWNLP